MPDRESLITKLEKGRAEFAYRCVKEVVDENSSNKELLKNYRAYSRKIPQMILSNGLGQTLAFVKSKAKNGNAYELLYSQMMDYLRSDSTARIKMPDNIELVEWVISLDSQNYRYVTEEILAFLNWVKRFAEGLIETEEESEE
ncbi:MAG: type III-B CRISPR module-associated protein Cmr5 [Caldisericia bacterium]|jgi:CRISPR-associated protein Cmr5|nr:type III-B CRISPR module-associated protein Cmr5 [Caldisericia bacterium]